MGFITDTITLSKEQKAETEIRALEAGVSDRVRVHLCDYRELPSSFEHAFDGFVSCEMIEVHIILRN
jgi:cyclopropane-fatty-acyl-phospholipid synthase